MRKTVVKVKFKSKKYYDRKINPQTFKPRDQVFLLKGPKPGKFRDLGYRTSRSLRNIK